MASLSFAFASRIFSCLSSNRDENIKLPTPIASLAAQPMPGTNSKRFGKTNAAYFPQGVVPSKEIFVLVLPRQFVAKFFAFTFTFTSHALQEVLILLVERQILQTLLPICVDSVVGVILVHCLFGKIINLLVEFL